MSRSPDRAAIERGNDLVPEVMGALGAVVGVTLYRNDVRQVLDSRTGGRPFLGLGGTGAPDIFAEIRTPSGVTAAVWLECKSGDHARLNKDQRAWFAAAKSQLRHVFVVRSVEHAREIVESFQRGEVPCE